MINVLSRVLLNGILFIQSIIYRSNNINSNSSTKTITTTTSTADNNNNIVTNHDTNKVITVPKNKEE